ncbi:MAG: dephospho-CoA kinase [Mariprofundus sp.]|nr:dephospho-CoA kinase [Mariprofundus sp.]
MSPHRVGLTGGIGTGKSTVAGIFAGLGIPVLDLDEVGQTVVQSDSSGLKQLVEAFGTNILNHDGSLNRKAMARHCFSDADRTAKLNAIMHPLIWQVEENWLSQQQGDYAIIEASVLLESGGAGRMDVVIVVLADMMLRRDRVLARGKNTAAEFNAIVARQCTDTKRREAADFIITNEGSLTQLRQQVIDIERLLYKQIHAN